MSRPGLSQDQIIQAAIELIEQQGYTEFSLHILAKQLNIKTPSLYNHFKNAKELKLAVNKACEQKMYQQMQIAIQNKARDEALLALGKAQLNFALEHPELYKVILSLPLSNDPDINTAAEETTLPIYHVLNEYDLTQQEVDYLQRSFRSLVHGFISLYQAGYLHHRDYSMKTSFEASLNYFLKLLHTLEEDKKDQND